jgi:hypothetical protein
MEKKYDNTNRGALFDNTGKKREGKQDPDISGPINVNGQEFQISGWKNENPQPGQPIYTTSIRPAKTKDAIPF